MSSRQIKLYSEQTTGGSKDITTTISNVNPQVGGTVMKEYAQRLNGFTTNTYKKTDLVETTNLDTETVPASKTESTFQLKVGNTIKSTITKAELLADTAITAVTNNTAAQMSLAASFQPNIDTITCTFLGKGLISIKGTNNSQVGAKIIFYLPETTNYTSATATLTVTE